MGDNSREEQGSCSVECSRGGLGKKTLAGLVTGAIVHVVTCPIHLAMVLGAVGINVNPPAPLVAAHRYLVEDVATPAVSYFRGDDTDYSRLPPHRFDRRTRRLVPVNPNVQIAHDVVDYSGWALGIPLGFITAHYLSHRRRRKKSVLYESQ